MEMTKPTERYERASFFERQLTARQKQILDLIVDGRTNGEIGVALGITLDGAKWNVSEILTKLGLADREEAASYWRWRKRRRAWHATTNFARAMFAAPVLKWAAGGAVVLVAGAIAVGGLVAMKGVVASDGGDRGGDELLLAQTTEVPASTVEPAAAASPTGSGVVQVASPGGRVVEATLTNTNEDGSQDYVILLNTWYRDSGTVRCERAVTGPPNPTFTLSIREGELVTHLRMNGSDLQGTDPRYSEEAVNPAWPPCTRAVGSTDNVPYGATLDQFLELMATRMGDDGAVVVAGTDTVLGRPVTLVDYTSDSIGTADPEYTTSGRSWFSEELGMILRGEEHSLGEDSVYEVVTLQLDEQLDDSLFVFTPPPGATLIPTPTPETPYYLADGSLAPNEFDPPPGVLAPIGQPEGWSLRGAHTDREGGWFSYSFYPSDSAVFYPYDPIWVAISVVPGGLLPEPGTSPNLPRVQIGGYSAVVSEEPSGVVQLTWRMPAPGGEAGVEVELWEVTADEFVALFPQMFGIQP